ncbi:MAG: glycerophosphodiester phosphodiesterase family protein [Candidatus Hecatellaceae archaeon]
MARCVAHRGASFWEPENSLAAIEAAVKLGADLVEVDVRRCGDGTLVAFHDASLERTTDGVGFLNQYGLQELKRFNLGGGERIPALTEVLEAVKGRIGLIAEVKEPGTERRLLEVVAEASLLDETIFTSFHHHVLPRIKQLNPKAKTGIIVRGSLLNPVEAARRAKAEYFFADYRHITVGLAAKLQRAGVKLAAWTVNEKEAVETLAGLNVDLIVSDRPELVTGEPLHRPLRAYLAGPIQEMEEHQEYRETLTEILHGLGFEVVDPWLREQAYYRGKPKNLFEAYQLVKRDLLDIKRCELLAAYLPKVSAGVAMEIFHAKTLGKKVFLVSPMESLSPWLLAHTDQTFKSFEEFEAYLRQAKERLLP